MTTAKEYLNSCFICGTKLPPFGEDISLVKSRKQICFKFKTFVYRYLNLKSSTNQNLLKSTLNLKSVGVNNGSKLICCSTCVLAVESFCETYEGLEQLQLEILRILKGISEQMTMTTSKSSTSFNNKFREKFVTAVATKQKGNYPHLRLKTLNEHQYPTRALRDSSSNSKFCSVANELRHHASFVSSISSIQHQEVPGIERKFFNAPSQSTASDSESMEDIEDVNQENYSTNIKACKEVIFRNLQENALSSSKTSEPEEINNHHHYDDADDTASFGNAGFDAVSDNDEASELIHTSSNGVTTFPGEEAMDEDLASTRQICKLNMKMSKDDGRKTNIDKKVKAGNLKEKVTPASKYSEPEEFNGDDDYDDGDTASFGNADIDDTLSVTNAATECIHTSTEFATIPDIRATDPVSTNRISELNINDKGDNEESTINRHETKRKMAIGINSSTRSAKSTTSLSDSNRVCKRSKKSKNHVKPHSEEKAFYCDFEFTTNRSLKRHMKLNFCKNLNSRSRFRKKIGQCTFCNKLLRWGYYMETHMSQHTKEKPFFCHTCNSEFSLNSDLLKHHRNNVHSNLKCDLCPHTFRDSGSLEKHKKSFHHQDGSQTKERRFKCDQCGFAFQYRHNLRDHLDTSFHVSAFPESTRRKAKPHKCVMCGKPIWGKSRVIPHMRTHTKEKPFYCPLCSGEFARIYDLTDHIRKGVCKNRHSKTEFRKKITQCLFCDKAFALPSLLRNHMAYHTEEKHHYCHICGTEFTMQSALIKHRKNNVHTQCDMCPKIFKDFASLETHKKSCHQNEGLEAQIHTPTDELLGVNDGDILLNLNIT